MDRSGIKPICSIAKDDDICEAVFKAISKIDLPDLNGKNVLLKPNVGRTVKKNTGINTSPDVVQAVFDYLRDKYDAKFFIGDSPITGVISREAFVESGYQSLMDRKDVLYVDLDSRKPLTLKIDNGRILKAVKVTGYYKDFDYIISIPVLKMHMHTGATLSLKNMKGMIYRKEKVKLHQLHCSEKVKQGHKELDIAIADLASVIAPDLAIIDAHYALEGMGPSAGDRVKMNTIIASTNYFAADLTALSTIGLCIDDVPHLRLLSKEYGIYTIGDIETIPQDISPFATTLKTPPEDIKINNCKVNLLDFGSCSACLYSIFQFITKNEQSMENYFNEYGQMNIAVGKQIPDPGNDTFLIGNCTSHKKKMGVFIKGCPPTQSSIKEMVEKKMLTKSCGSN
jgi:uncharacterized protein (DUF362 family)